MLTDVVRNAGITDSFEEIMSVDDVQVYKPSARVYQLVLDRLGVSRSEVCFVSSNGWDAHAAAAFGFNVVWANRMGVPDDNLPGEINAQTSDLMSLPGLLASART